MFTRDVRKGFPDEELLSVYREHGVVPKASRNDNNNRPSEDLSAYQLVEPGDLVVNKMKAWQGSVAISRHRGIVSPAYFVYRPHHRADGRFLHHLLRSRPFIAAYMGLSKGVRIGQWDLEPQNFSRLKMAIPPIEEQRAIADYLDRETVRIDHLVEEQMRLISMLRERRQAVIDLAFDAIPRNSRIARACVDIVDCPHTTPAADPDGQFEAVRTASVRAGRFRPGQGLLVSEATWRERNATGSPMQGDVLFAREGGSAGEAAMVPSSDICLGQRMVLLRINHKVCDGEFLLWQIYSTRIQDHFRLATSGAAAGNIRLPVLRRTAIWLPAIETQRELALTAETERFIELARERRTALITAAVTGQVDLREAA
jgi:type I restriction enzyme S subunit